jgi:TfoX/Sxy family transcriptional regulator of competence genes
LNMTKTAITSYFQKILRKRLNKKGCTEYEVKWVGYPLSKNTWEAIENLDKCPEVLKEFEMRALKKQAKTHSRARKKSESTPAALKLPPKKK